MDMRQPLPLRLEIEVPVDWSFELVLPKVTALVEGPVPRH